MFEGAQNQCDIALKGAREFAGRVPRARNVNAEKGATGAAAPYRLFPSIAQQLHELPTKAAVLDGEVVATSDADGLVAGCTLAPAKVFGVLPTAR